jgi:exosortase
MTLQALILTALLAFHYRYVLYGLGYAWWNDSDWSHGFLIPLFSLYYLYTQRHRLPLDLPNHAAPARATGALLIALAFVMYLGSTVYQIDYPKKLALLISIMGVVLMVCGLPMARWSWFAVAVLVFALPLPHRLYVQLTMPLQVMAAHVSGAALRIIFSNDIFVQVHNVTVDYVYKGKVGTPLNVAEACSGIRLLITMMALGVAMAFISDRPIWQRMVIILSCLPIAVFCNFIRVTITGVLHVQGHNELATGFPHTMLGLGMLGIAFSLYLGISYVLSHLYVESES